MKKFLISLGLATFLISGTAFANGEATTSTTNGVNTTAGASKVKNKNGKKKKVEFTEEQKAKIKNLTAQLKPYRDEIKKLPGFAKAKNPERRLARQFVARPESISSYNLSANVKNILK